MLSYLEAKVNKKKILICKKPIAQQLLLGKKKIPPCMKAATEIPTNTKYLSILCVRVYFIHKIWKWAQHVSKALKKPPETQAQRYDEAPYLLSTNGTSLLSSLKSTKSPKHGNSAGQLYQLSQNVKKKRCLEHLLSCHHPPGWALVTVPCAARYPAVCCKAERWMLSNPPELIFLTLWKPFSRPSIWECHLPKGKQITAASSSSRRAQLSLTLLFINNPQQWWHRKNVFYSRL